MTILAVYYFRDVPGNPLDCCFNGHVFISVHEGGRYNSFSYLSIPSVNEVLTRRILPNSCREGYKRNWNDVMKARDPLIQQIVDGKCEDRLVWKAEGKVPAAAENKSTCTCRSIDLFNFGCKCGGS